MSINSTEDEEKQYMHLEKFQERYSVEPENLQEHKQCKINFIAKSRTVNATS